MPETRSETTVETADNWLCYAALVELPEGAFLAPDKVLVFSNCAAERQNLVSSEGLLVCKPLNIIVNEDGLAFRAAYLVPDLAVKIAFYTLGEAVDTS